MSGLGLLTSCIAATAFLSVAQPAAAQAKNDFNGQPPAHHEAGTEPAGGDQTLEVAPKIDTTAPPPAVESEQPALASPESQPLGSTSDYVNSVNAAEGRPVVNNGRRPYLGIAARFVVAKPNMGQEIPGLEIVSIEPNSPAARAGLKGRTAPTSLGATGDTAGNLFMPLGLGLIPLLEKSGQLGQPGDVIVAIDDRRVSGEFDLANQLDTMKPGDTIYLTVMHRLGDSSRKTVKVAVKLAAPAEAMANAGSAAAPSKASVGSSAPSSSPGR
jgi:hypothetical protein